MTPELLAPGLWRIPLSMPVGPAFVNVYLLRSCDGWILIDTGMGFPPVYDELAAALAHASVEPAQLRQILLTHVHPDHSGNAPRLTGLSCAPICVHPADVELLAWILRPGSAERLGATLLAAGAAPDRVTEVIVSAARLFALFPPLTAGRLLHHGDSFSTALGPLDVIHTPGHSPGHVCFHLPARGLLFAGDTVLPEIFPHIGFVEDQDCLGDFLLTLDRLQAIPEARILPAHGLPFDGLDAWCQRTRAEALRRLERVRSLAAEGLNPAQIVDRIWQRELRGTDYHLALTSVLAQLAHPVPRSGPVQPSAAAKPVQPAKPAPPATEQTPADSRLP
jgi:glyoxylase-like metal-dependent hydrolase (beta-lactamase superfamily II)